MLKTLLACVLLLTTGSAIAAEKEHEVQLRYCAGLTERGMKVDEALPDRSEADCVTAEYAVEVDFTEHWAEAIGQALHYAAVLNKRPGIILVCKSDTGAKNCSKHRARLDETMSYWRIGMMLWYCPTGATSLKDCETKDYFGPG